MSETICHIHVLAVIIAVPYKDAFFQFNSARLCKFAVLCCGSICIGNWESFCQLAGRIYLAEQNICQCIARFHTCIICPDDGLCLISPRHLHRCSRYHYHCHIRLYFKQCFNDLILTVGQLHGSSVITFHIIFMIHSAYKNDLITFLCKTEGLLQKLLSFFRFCGIVHSYRCGQCSQCFCIDAVLLPVHIRLLLLFFRQISGRI